MGLFVPPRVFPHEKSIEPIQKIEEDPQQAPQEVYRKELRPKLKEGIFIFRGKKIERVLLEPNEIYMIRGDSRRKAFELLQSKLQQEKHSKKIVRNFFGVAKGNRSL